MLLPQKRPRKGSFLCKLFVMDSLSMSPLLFSERFTPRNIFLRAMRLKECIWAKKGVSMGKQFSTLLSAALVAALCSSASAYTLSGTVTDKDGKAIQGADVKLIKKNKSRLHNMSQCITGRNRRSVSHRLVAPVVSASLTES